jgi:hypothetical protein
VADVSSAFISGHQAGKAQKDHEQQLEENKLRQMILKHQLDRVKVESAVKDWEFKTQGAKAKFEALEGQPARAYGEGGPQPVAFPGLPPEMGGGDGYSRTPMTLEDITRSSILNKRMSASPVDVSPGHTLTAPNIDTGAYEPVYTNPTPAPVAGANSQFGTFKQVYAEQHGAPTFEALSPELKAGLIPAYNKANADPDVQARFNQTQDATEAYRIFTQKAGAERWKASQLGALETRYRNSQGGGFTPTGQRIIPMTPADLENDKKRIQASYLEQIGAGQNSGGTQSVTTKDGIVVTVGQPMKLKNGKTVMIDAIHPDGTFDYH